MKNYRGFDAENFKKLFNMRNVVRTFNVFADGDPAPAGGGDPAGTPATPPVATPTGGTAPVNFEHLIAKAREEEKNKLYPKIKKLEDENATLVQNHNNDLIAIATKDKEIERLTAEIQTLQSTADGNETEAIKSLKKELKAAQTEIETLKSNTPNEEELRASIRAELEAEYEIKHYRETKILEAQGKIIPELVSGNTKEEIDASVTASMERYNSIVGSAVPTPPVNPTLNPANPASQPLKANEEGMKALLDLDPTSKEYREARKALGLR